MGNERLPHGGDWAGFTIEYGREPLDFSMNVNPLGISAQVQAAIAKAGASADRYPDPLCRALIQRLAEHEAVPPEWIFCGNGAADIIFRLAQALKPEATGQSADDVPESGEANTEEQPRLTARQPRLLITAPTFSEYETAFAENGWAVERFLLREENGFQIMEDILERIGPASCAGDAETMHAADPAGKVDAVFLCEPNNPTGVTTDSQLLHQIWEKCRQTGTTLVIDECFNGFLEDPEAHSMKAALAILEDDLCDGAAVGSKDQKKHTAASEGCLIILKAFTKLYGMAGVRLGYCLCADETIIGKIRQAGPPWNVSSLAQEAGIAALEDRAHVKEGLRIVREERPWLRRRLAELGIDRVYGEANYLLFYVKPTGKASQGQESKPGAETVRGQEAALGTLYERMRDKGILIRSCSNYPGLGEGWYRIAVRTREENEQLIGALREVLKAQIV